MAIVLTFGVLLLSFLIKNDVFVYSYENSTWLPEPLPKGPEGHVTWPQCDDKIHQFSGRYITSLPDYDAKHLDLRFCNITKVNKDQFLGFPNLVYIEAYANNMVYIHPAAFKPVSNLTHLDLTNNKFTTVPVLDEHSLPNLKWLELYDNFISGLYNPRTFFACVKLEDLSLSHNFIEYIHPDVFKPLTELRSLTLSDNKIMFLYDSTFVQNGKLRLLSLRDNSLSSLPVGFVSSFKCDNYEYHWIGFNGNPFHCACLLEIIAEWKRLQSSYCYAPLVISLDEDKPVCVFSGSFECHRHEPPKLPQLSGGGVRLLLLSRILLSEKSWGSYCIAPFL